MTTYTSHLRNGTMDRQIHVVNPYVSERLDLETFRNMVLNFTRYFALS